MPVLKFTEGDRLASIVVPTDWYHMEITEIEGPKASTSGVSFNFFVKAQITDGAYAGKEISIVINTKSKSPSILGTMQFFPQSWFLMLQSAIRNLPLDKVDLQMDTDELLRKAFDGKIEKGIQEGVPMNTLLTVLPAGTGVDVKTPF